MIFAPHRGRLNRGGEPAPFFIDWYTQMVYHLGVARRITTVKVAKGTRREISKESKGGESVDRTLRRLLAEARDCRGKKRRIDGR